MNGKTPKKDAPAVAAETLPADRPAGATATPDAPGVPETGGPKGLEPTRFGDWERKGRCVDF